MIENCAQVGFVCKNVRNMLKRISNKQSETIARNNTPAFTRKPYCVRIKAGGNGSFDLLMNSTFPLYTKGRVHSSLIEKQQKIPEIVVHLKTVH